MRLQKILCYFDIWAVGILSCNRYSAGWVAHFFMFLLGISHKQAWDIPILLWPRVNWVQINPNSDVSLCGVKPQKCWLKKIPDSALKSGAMRLSRHEVTHWYSILGLRTRIPKTHWYSSLPAWNFQILTKLRHAVLLGQHSDCLFFREHHYI